MVIFPLAPDQTIAQMWPNGARGGTPPADRNYNLRDRPHNRQLPDRMSHLTNCNFIVRMLFCELLTILTVFTFYFLSSCILSVSACLFTILWSDSCSIKETFDFHM